MITEQSAYRSVLFALAQVGRNGTSIELEQEDGQNDVVLKDGTLQANDHTVWNGEWHCEGGNEQCGPWTLHLDVRYRGRKNREVGEWVVTMAREGDVLTLSPESVENVALAYRELSVGASWEYQSDDSSEEGNTSD